MNVAVRSDVEGRMCRRDVRRDAHALDVRDLFCCAFFDGNVIAIRDQQIQGGNWRGDVKRYVVLFRQNGNLVGSNLVRGVTIGGVLTPTVRSYSMNGFMGARAPSVGAVPPSADSYVVFAKDSEMS